MNLNIIKIMHIEKSKRLIIWYGSSVVCGCIDKPWFASMIQQLTGFIIFVTFR